MSHAIGDQFIEALGVLETEGDLVPLVGLFHEQATIWNVQMHDPLQGPGAVERFWAHYRQAFTTVESVFTHREESDHCIVLEWNSAGKQPNGEPVSYSGVTILEHDGERILAFRSYYDTHALALRAA
jgi:ketosteroid isomerase-like protein